MTGLVPVIPAECKRIRRRRQTAGTLPIGRKRRRVDGRDKPGHDGTGGFSAAWNLVLLPGVSAARYEQQMSGALDESGPRRIGLLELLQLVGKLIVDRQGGRIPTRIRREATVEQVEPAYLFDIELLDKIALQFGRRKEVKTEIDVPAIMQFDFAPISAVVVSELARLFERIYENTRGTAGRAHRGDELAAGDARKLRGNLRESGEREMVEDAVEA